MLKIMTKLTVAISLVILAAMPCRGEEDIYSIKIEELPEKACAQCHYPVYTDIRDHGGAHRQPCRDCHETYHNFRRALKWEERVPACQDCHQTPHGEEQDMLACMGCHENEHAPVFSIKLEKIEPLCARCHPSQSDELKKFPSAHSELACTECHQEKHGRIPDCTECHSEPHSAFVDNAHCTRCHSVHMPMELNFGSDIPNDACRDCHGEPVNLIKTGKFAHAKLKCVLCHSGTHGTVPECVKCHDTPHSREMIKEAGGCGECHGNPHSLEPSDQ
jgi:hypothetical protein